jgi:site-specific recombinase XerD
LKLLEPWRRHFTRKLRHQVISHALAGGRTLAEVKAAAGHASLLTTSVYLHVAVEDEEKVGDLFCFAR